MRFEKIGVQVHYIPVNMQYYYQNIVFKIGDYKPSEKLYSEIISIPISPSLTKEQQNSFVKILREELTKQ